MNAQRILDRLEAVKAVGEDRWTARCPAHADRNPSLSVAIGGDGRVLIYCHAGCPNDVVLAELRLGYADLFDDEHQAAPARAARPFTPPRRKKVSSEAEVSEYQRALREDDALLSRLAELRGWTRRAVESLGLGWDGERIVFPVLDATGAMTGILRYLPGARTNGETKMLAAAGSIRELWPALEALSGTEPLWIVEGEPDAVSMASIGLSAVAVPGAAGWQSRWADRLAGRKVIVCADCDAPGRELAQRIAEDACMPAASVKVLDLDPGRNDGFDVGDMIAEAAGHGPARIHEVRDLLCERAASIEPVSARGGREAGPGTTRVPEAGELLSAVERVLRRYVILPGEHEITAVALWVLHTWAIDGAHATPYLLVISPEKRSGKTRLLEVLRLLVREPWHTNSVSEAALFRKIQRDTPTLLLDEIDAVFGSNTERTEPLRALLNAGNRRGVTVTRCSGREHDVSEFSVFCPKVLAGIDKDRRLPETIRDRSVTLRMRRKHDAEPVERFRERKAQGEVVALVDAARAWGRASAVSLLGADPAVPDALDDRAADAWEPLLAIADLAGRDWVSRARDAALALSGADGPDQTSYGALLLSKLKDLLSGRQLVSSAEAVAEINSDEDMPFGGWSDGKGMDPRQLAKFLKPYGIKPIALKMDGKTIRGYRADELADAWARYLPPDPQRPQLPATTHPDAGANGHSSNISVAEVAEVADAADARDGSGSSGGGHAHAAAEAGSRILAACSDLELLATLPGSIALESEILPKTVAHDPSCGYPDLHSGKSWATRDGRLVCGVCHPPATPGMVAA